MARNEKAQVTGEGQKNGLTPDDIPDGWISWEEHHMAFAEYSRRIRTPYTSEEVEKMGGFTYRQVADLLGHNSVTWELRDPIRYDQFVLKTSDMPPDLTQAVEVSVDVPPMRSHIRDSFERPICRGVDDAPDGPFFFDSAEGPHCAKCFTKMNTWLNWWVDAGKKTGV